MSNSKVLALKYRPKNFDELIGQETVSKTLKYSLENNSLANAYLFSGLRGSGKTSSARIFAKTVLCEKAPISTPCDICDSCKMANSSSHIDIIEMDAASNRKIDDIRDLIEQTQYQPSTGKYKIFIIDEVHMLTKEAFNALLKTLEEPPEYIKFILATTDPLKLPATILSRTQHFSFKTINQNLVIDYLKKILRLEGIDYDNESVTVIARSGKGSLRDTLTTLQQAIQFSKNSLNIDDVTEMLGLINPEVLENIFNLIIKRERDELLNEVKELANYEAEMIIDEFINFLKIKMFDKSIKIEIHRLENIFSALNEGKTLLFTGADSEFVLYFIFLKMIANEVEKKVVVIEEQIKEVQIQTISDGETQNIKHKNSETPNVNIEVSPKQFFNSSIIPNIIAESGNNTLRNCIEKNVELESFENGSIFVKFCFENKSCENILRLNYNLIKKITLSKFDERYKQKTKFEYVKCSQNLNLSNESYKDFFEKDVLKSIVESNLAGGKISDDKLTNILNYHLKFVSFRDNIISIKFCFNDDNDIKSILRNRFENIKNITISKFNERSKQITEFKYVECFDKIDTVKIKEKIPKISQKSKIISDQPKNLDSFISDVKNIFKINNENILITKNDIPKSNISEKEIVSENTTKFQLPKVREKPNFDEVKKVQTDNVLFNIADEQVDFTFDVETNGFKGSDVLSISFIISKGDEILNKQNRYYFPEVRFMPKPQEVHGLTGEKITNFRKNTNYPKLFKDDLNWIIETIQEFSVTNFVAHNIGFDISFMPPEIHNGIKNGRYSLFCTMEKNKEFVQIRNSSGNWKSPKLIEACEKHGIEFDENEAHDSSYDTLKAFELYRKTVKLNKK